MELTCSSQTYLAKVVGEFPEKLTVDAFILYAQLAKKAKTIPKEEINGLRKSMTPSTVNKEATHTNGKSTPDDAADTRGEPKDAETSFVRRWTDGKYSVVECYPKTGRTHQIRVHLEHSGFPIANDPTYGPKDVEKNAESSKRSQEILDGKDKPVKALKVKTQ